MAALSACPDAASVFAFPSTGSLHLKQRSKKRIDQQRVPLASELFMANCV
jgi:hypothetical protein